MIFDFWRRAFTTTFGGLLRRSRSRAWLPLSAVTTEGKFAFQRRTEDRTEFLPEGLFFAQSSGRFDMACNGGRVGQIKKRTGALGDALVYSLRNWWISMVLVDYAWTNNSAIFKGAVFIQRT